MRGVKSSAIQDSLIQRLSEDGDPKVVITDSAAQRCRPMAPGARGPNGVGRFLDGERSRGRCGTLAPRSDCSELEAI